MGFRLKVEGKNETIELGMDNLTSVKYKTDTPDDSDARSTDLGVILEAEGKIITAIDGEEADHTMKLALWSIVSAEDDDAYRKVTLSVIAADQVVREVQMPNTFVVDYTENYSDSTGRGTFKIFMKQKKEKTRDVKITGGYAASEE